MLLTLFDEKLIAELLPNCSKTVLSSVLYIAPPFLALFEANFNEEELFAVNVRVPVEVLLLYMAPPFSAALFELNSISPPADFNVKYEVIDEVPKATL